MHNKGGGGVSSIVSKWWERSTRSLYCPLYIKKCSLEISLEIKMSLVRPFFFFFFFYIYCVIFIFKFLVYIMRVLGYFMLRISTRNCSNIFGTWYLFFAASSRFLINNSDYFWLGLNTRSLEISLIFVYFLV